MTLKLFNSLIIYKIYIETNFLVGHRMPYINPIWLQLIVLPTPFNCTSMTLIEVLSGIKLVIFCSLDPLNY